MENKIALGSLANLLAQSTGKSRKLCEDFLREFFRLVSETLVEGESVKIKGFGSFKLSEVESRNSVNVNTGEPIEIASYKKVVFSPAKELAAAINSPFQEFESVEIEDEMPEEMIEEEEKLGDEDIVDDQRLEQGSDEEGEDDEITYEAYQDLEPRGTSEDSLDEYENNNEEILTPPIVNIANATESEPEKVIVYPGNQIENSTEDEYEETLEKGTEIKDTNLKEEIIIPTMNSEFSTEPKASKSHFGIGFLVGSLVTLLICLIIFMLGCFFDWWPVNFGSSKEAVHEPVIEQTETPNEDENIEENNIEAETVKTIQPAKDATYDTVSTTRYLTTIARDHYGNFNFWPYIYLENESILGHPDRITPGTKVIVPDLSKYGVDPSSKKDLETAKKKAAEIYAKFK